MNFGFLVKTPGRTYELYTITYLDAKHWVDALIAGRDIATGLVASGKSGLSSVEPLTSEWKPPLTSKERENSRSTESTTADGSDSGRSSSELDRELYSYGGYTAGAAAPPPPRGPQPRQPPVAQSQEQRPVAQPPVAQPPVAYGCHGVSSMFPAGNTAWGGTSGYVATPAPVAASAHSGHPTHRPEAAALHFHAPIPAPAAAPEIADPFAALDALEELAGPVPEQSVAPTFAAPQKNIQGALMREARAMVMNKGAKPSAEATEALQRLKSTPVSQSAFEGNHTAVAPAPTAALAPRAAVAAAPAVPPPPANPPPAVQSAVLYHNPSAESWDSDDDNELPKNGLLANQARPPLTPAQLAPAPLASQPPQPAPASAPPKQVPQRIAASSAETSGWDSDDDDATAKQVAAPPLRHQLASGTQQTVEASGWDSDEDDSASKKRVARAPIVSRDSCGAPRQATETFVTASSHAASASSNTKPGLGDDLDDLLGEVLAADAAVKRNGANHGLVPGFQCTACDFQVLRVENVIWSSAVEYMFFRNNYPNVQKLRQQLVTRKDCCAYCCQCSWKSAESAAPLADVAEGLRWRTIGIHA
jgi:hypothetical protein